MEVTNQSIPAIYNERSSTYDDSLFHNRQAHEYIQCAKLQEGQSVLDLACGTGLVTLLAKDAVGEGKVIGIDMSSGMLEVARRKISNQHLDITFIEHDITDLSGLQLGTFDVITCASALLLMEEPLTAIKHWASLLAPNGRLLTDVIQERNVIGPSILTKIGPEVGRSLKWNGNWVESVDSLRQLFIDAGLVVEEVFETVAYETRDYKIEDGPEVFEKIIASPMFRLFGEPAIKEKAKGLFVDNFRNMAGEDGLVHEEVRFYMGIARKGNGDTEDTLQTMS
ncbi:MAG: hypothetical protein Q9178_007156 [Gyalolechia marmorata]